MPKMLKKIVSTTLMVAMLAVVILATGCEEKSEIKYERKTTIEKKVISQDTVVE